MASREVQKLTARLTAVNACWAHSNTKTVMRLAGDWGDNVRPTWNIHPDRTYPHAAQIRKFDTLADLESWVEVEEEIKRISDKAEEEIAPLAAHLKWIDEEIESEECMRDPELRDMLNRDYHDTIYEIDSRRQAAADHAAFLRHNWQVSQERVYR